MRKQAVVLIHGVGEQRPMDALRGFVDAVWSSDDELFTKHTVRTVWSKPDHASRSFELRRLTTGRSKEGSRTDFYELYWAHRMDKTELKHVIAWLSSLLFRSPGRVPRGLRSVWLLLLVALLLGAAAVTLPSLPSEMRPFSVPAWLITLLGASATFCVVPALRQVVGDAARYLHVSPANVHRRHEIRQAGVELLENLHETGDYERIVVVGHDLGSVIGYDVLCHLWARRARTFPLSLENVVDAHDASSKALREEPSEGARKAYRERQGELFDALREHDSGWRVSDFVTLGSPLAHAELLMAHDAFDLQRRKDERELPTCPPIDENASVAHRLGGESAIHHGAVFAPVRWTNIYFPRRLLLFGDPVGGPCAPVFGPGVQDLRSRHPALFNHRSYWRLGSDAKAPHLKALRQALNLLNHSEQS